MTAFLENGVGRTDGSGHFFLCVFSLPRRLSRMPPHPLRLKISCEDLWARCGTYLTHLASEGVLCNAHNIHNIIHSVSHHSQRRDYSPTLEVVHCNYSLYRASPGTRAIKSRTTLKTTLKSKSIGFGASSESRRSEIALSE